MVTKQQIKEHQEQLRANLKAALTVLNREYEQDGWDISAGGILMDDGFWLVKLRADHFNLRESLLAYVENDYFAGVIAEIPGLVEEIKRKIKHA